MNVFLLGYTVTTGYTQKMLGLPGRSTHAELLSEFAGRACYQSWSKPNPETRETRDYVKSIIEKEHFSVLEHGSVTFYVTGVSRSLTHELIRHRHLSFSELSQRFVDVKTAEPVLPPAIRGLSTLEWELQDSMADAKGCYGYLADELSGEYPDLTRKQVREAARAVMPNMTETRIVVTANHRAWREFLYKRWNVAADVEIRDLAGEMLRYLRDLAPSIYEDVPELPYGS